MDENEKYNPQKKYLNTQKQLRVWMEPEKFDKFKIAVKMNNTTVYAVIHEFIDNYLRGD